MTTPELTGFATWAHLEAMGHRSHWGSVSEFVIAGAAFLRVDVFAIGDEAARSTFYYPPGSVYCLTPCSEEKARLASTPYDQRPRPELESGGPYSDEFDAETDANELYDDAEIY